MPDQKTCIETGCCQECGAPQVGGLDCWGMLGAIISWEYDDPELLSEHFKTVATYNLQHPAKFHDEAIAGLRGLFMQHIDNGLPLQDIRKHVSAMANGGKQVLKREHITPVPKRWAKTIADVYLPDHPEGAAQRVRGWANVVRTEL